MFNILNKLLEGRMRKKAYFSAKFFFVFELKDKFLNIFLDMEQIIQDYVEFPNELQFST